MVIANLRKEYLKNNPNKPKNLCWLVFLLLHVGNVSLKVYDVLGCVSKKNSVRVAAKQVHRD